MNQSDLQSILPLLSSARSNLNFDIQDNSKALGLLFRQHSQEEEGQQLLCVLPSLKLVQAPSKRRPSVSPTDKRVLQQSCAEKLSHPVEFKCSDVHLAPRIIRENLVSSVLYLVKSRLSNSLKAFLHKSNDVSTVQKQIMMNLFLSPKAVNCETIITSFRPSLLPSRIVETEDDVENMTICFEAAMDVSIFGEDPFTIKLRCSGNVEYVSLDSKQDSSSKVRFIRVGLDSNVLLQQMMNQARLCAKAAFHNAASLANTVMQCSDLSTPYSSYGSLPSGETITVSGIEAQSKTKDMDMPPPPPRPKSIQK